jgi:tyrosyl-tRNA synthetase
MPDSLARNYFVLLTSMEMEKADALLESDPRDAKVRLALDIVSQYHDPEAAKQLETAFHSGVTAPEELTHKAELEPGDLKDGKTWIVRLLTAANFASSNSEARKLIAAGAVTVDGVKITDHDADIEVRDGQVLQVGKKRMATIVIRRGE